MRAYGSVGRFLALLLIGGCAAQSPVDLEPNKDLVRLFTSALNAADWVGLDSIISPDFQRHSQATPGAEVRSAAEFRALQEEFLKGVPDQRVELGMLLAEGDLVTARAVYRGTQTGQMGPFPPTGKAFESTFIAIFRIQDRRIAELWVEWDNMAILTQLGLLPPPPPPER